MIFAGMVPEAHRGIPWRRCERLAVSGAQAMARHRGATAALPIRLALNRIAWEAWQAAPSRLTRHADWAVGRG